jgi:ribosomal protein S18 acetylase RimI-like enzyme
LIRKATMDDYDALCALFDEVDALHREALPHVFRDPGDVARSKAYVASIVEDENACLWVAEQRHKIVGLLHISLRETRDIPILVPRRYAVVENLAVSQAYRRRGLGSALLRAAERWALDKKAAQVELHVWEFNEGARTFYEMMGYGTASRRLWRSLSAQRDAYRGG